MHYVSNERWLQRVKSKFQCRESSWGGVKLFSGVYEEIQQLDLRPLQTRVVALSPAEASWMARVCTACDSSLADRHLLTKLLQLGSQTVAKGNLKAASALLSSAQRSPLLQSDPSTRALADYMSLKQQYLLGTSPDDALQDLAAWVREEGRLDTVGGNAFALTCVELASWMESQSSSGVSLGQDFNVEVSGFSQLWHHCNLKHRAQLSLLVTAAQQAPEMALPWAALSNWMHSRLEDGLAKVISSLFPLFSIRKSEN